MWDGGDTSCVLEQTWGLQCALKWLSEKERSWAIIRPQKLPTGVGET